MSRLVMISVAAAFGLASAGAALAQGQSPSAGQSAFLKKAIEGDNSEIMLGQLAEQKGGTAGVRDFGRTLVQDHTQAKQQASTLAQSVGVTPPTQPMKEASAEQQKLQSLSGAAFDREFVRYMANDHRKDIADFRKEAAKHDGQVSAMAKKSLPTLRKHLSIAERLEKNPKA